MIFYLALIFACYKAVFVSDPFLGEKHEYGFLPENDKEQIFYWLFKARTRRPSNLVLWFEGGPGCSGTSSMLLLNGPYKVQPKSTNYGLNPYSWTNFADVMFTDQPMGTGLSNCPVDRIPKDGEGMAKKFFEFFEAFLKKHPEYDEKNTTLYMAGHSYVGHYLPSIIKLLYKNKFKYRIGGIMIGNLYTDGTSLSWSYPTYGFKHYGISKFTYYKAMATHYLFRFFYAIGLQEIAMWFYNLTYKLGYGYYKDATQDSINECPTMGAKDYITAIVKGKFLPAIDTKNKTWIRCNSDVSAVATRLDHMRDYSPYLDFILDNKIPLIVYYGNKDYLCNVDSWEYMIRKMKWNGAKEFIKQTPNSFWIDGVEKGKYMHYENLWHFEVYNAGHVAIGDKPEVGYYLMRKLMGLNK